MIKVKINPLAEADLMENYGLKILEDIIDKKYLKRIKNTSDKKALILELKKISEENENGLLKKKRFLVYEYNKLEKEYNKELSVIFGKLLKSPKICYLTPVYLGIAEVISGKYFFIDYALKEKEFRYIFFHELTHLYYTDFVKKTKKPGAFCSSLMESIAHLIIFKTKIKKILNIKIRYEKIKFVLKNKRFMNKMEKLWKNRKDFGSFLDETIKLNKQTKEVIIC